MEKMIEISIAKRAMNGNFLTTEAEAEFPPRLIVVGTEKHLQNMIHNASFISSYCLYVRFEHPQCYDVSSRNVLHGAKPNFRVKQMSEFTLLQSGAKQ
jgi:hypothetical protein